MSVLAYTTYEDGTEYSEMSAHEIQTPGNHPKERMQQHCFCLVKNREQKRIFAV